jgi:hypothetical protein
VGDEKLGGGVVIEKHVSNFHATYDELTQELLRAMNAFVPDRLQDWFAHLDGEPEAGAIIKKLEAGLAASRWSGDIFSVRPKRTPWRRYRENAWREAGFCVPAP